jgi:flagellar basal body-associated protein FliL
MLPDALSKIIDPLPYSIKIFLGVMLGLQTLAVVVWMVMMGKEISTKETKEKQS